MLSGVHRALMLLLALGFAGDAAALRCGGRVVDTGDYDFQVRERCGEPYWYETYSELRVIGAHGPLEHRVERVFEDWYYNFGSNRLVQRLRFRDGRLVRVEALGYGSGSIGGQCNDVALSRGTTSGELVLRCGEPASRTARYRDNVIRDGYGERIRPQRYEEWVYRFSDSRYARLVVLVDGKISRVEPLTR